MRVMKNALFQIFLGEPLQERLSVFMKELL